MPEPFSLQQAIVLNVAHALAEDIGSGDLSAQLVALEQQGTARIITREPMILCGQAWVQECFRQLDPSVQVEFLHTDGSEITANATLFTVKGPARSLLTGERTALNFLQLLSGTATTVHAALPCLKGTSARLFDTRKTIPGLRLAQKYAVRCGGGHNHRLGLYDAFLIKENHIMAAGSIHHAVAMARRTAPGKPVEVEVENMQELEAAISAGTDIIMLDNFTIDNMRTAVTYTNGRCKLEASGGLDLTTLHQVAATGVDYISMGSLTKHLQSIDLSMRFI